MSDENDSSDKTEDPTQKRLDDAHEKGDVYTNSERLHQRFEHVFACPNSLRMSSLITVY